MLACFTFNMRVTDGDNLNYTIQMLNIILLLT